MAEDAEAFLADEVQRLQQQSEALEARLAQFKEKNLRKLPELTSLNMNLMERTEREYFEISFSQMHCSGYIHQGILSHQWSSFSSPLRFPLREGVLRKTWGTYSG